MFTVNVRVSLVLSDPCFYSGLPLCLMVAYLFFVSVDVPVLGDGRLFLLGVR